jgi:hypothetical protein
MIEAIALGAQIRLQLLRLANEHLELTCWLVGWLVGCTCSCKDIPQLCTKVLFEAEIMTNCLIRLCANGFYWA